MTAHLRLHSKKVLDNGIVIEMKIWEVAGKSYSDGFKYSLIAIDSKGDSKVLMDNHKPKGHHYHIDKDEFPYLFQSLDQLVDDFRSLVLKHLGVKI